MSENFTPIETQEQFDSAIAKRLARAEQKYTEQFSGYISPTEFEEKTKSLTDQITELGNSLTAANEKAKADADAIAELEARIKANETASVKSRIAHEFGLPYELAHRLTGDDEESIRADAESMKSILGTVKTPAPPVPNPNDSVGGDKSRMAALMKMSADLK